MANVVSDILLTPVRLLFAPVNTAVPADTVAYGAAWAGWTELGYTTEPLTASFSEEVYRVFVQQLTASVKKKKVTEELVFETVFAEMNSDVLELAFQGTVTETPAGPGQPAKRTLKFGGSTTVPVFAFGAEGMYELDDGTILPVRLIVYRATFILNGQLQFAKNKESGVPVRIEAELDTAKSVGEQLAMLDIQTAASGS
jgi:hypothetical protein